MDKTIIAQKFGGTSVATPERRQRVVGHARRELEAGNQVALVVSATGRRGDPYATDTILDLLRHMGGPIDPRNYSFLFVTGEMISVAIMVHTLQQAGIPAVALTGGMAGITTDDFYMSAHVIATDNRALCNYLEQGLVPIVCGGQGLTQTNRDFSILGRDSSDTSGVLVGIMVNAERADIYTDVEYVHAVDPLIVQHAPARRYVSYAAAYEMARFGTKVIKTGAVQLGMEHHLPIRVRSTFSQDPGTLIGAEEDPWPLVGLPLVASTQIAVLRGQDLDAAGQLSLERHVGLLRLVDASSDDVVLCAPLGDTATWLDKELSMSGITTPTWQRGYSLLSLIGKKAALAEMEAKANLALRRKAIHAPYREVTDCRATFVVPEQQSTAALLAVYAELREYLD
jgi:aspartate kinase